MSLQSIITAVLNFFKNLKPEVHTAAVKADQVLNAFKTWEDTTPLGQFVENDIEPLVPGLGIAVQNYLPVAIKALKWVEAETDKSDDQVVADGLNYIKTISDPNIKAAQNNTLAGLLGHFIASQDGNALTIQQHLILPQIIHNPAILQVAA